jgi:hypothetical protein
MLMNQEPDWNIDDLTDTEICAAIRYLEPDPRSANEQDEWWRQIRHRSWFWVYSHAHDRNKDNVVVISVGLLCNVLLVLAILWLQ